MSIKKIAITLGDIGGIGPEITFNAISELKNNDHFQPIIYGTSSIFNISSLKHWKKKFTIVNSLSENILHDNSTIFFVDIGSSLTNIHIGSPNKDNGLLSFQFIQRATEDLKKFNLSGLVTAPICKESLSLANLKYTGHTTILKHLTSSKDVSMAFYTPKLKTVLNSIHIPFNRVIDYLTESYLFTSFKNSIKFSNILGIKSPKIALSALNPHASESGLFGSEEGTILSPLLTKWNNQSNINILGPFSADTLYRRAYQNEFDIIISLYHDQALIPIKLIGFNDAVNVTVGLPFLRTSPDHGTAFDIAYQQKPSSKSMIESILFHLSFSL